MSQINKFCIRESYLIYIIPAIFALVSLSITDPPLIYDDLYRFYRYYEIFKEFSFQEFVDYIKEFPDYLLGLYVYIFVKIGLPVNILLSIITFITTFIILKVSVMILGKEKTNFFSIAFITTAISVPALLSGIRNLHSIALVYLVIYFYLNNKYLKSIFLYIVSLLVHFSSLIYLPVILFSVNVKLKRIYFFWLISFLGFVLPFIMTYPFQDNINHLSTVPIIRKIQHYTFTQDYYFRLTDVKIILVSIYKFSWYIFLLVFLHFQCKNKNENIWVKILFTVSILMNLIFTYLTIFERISFFAKILFVVCLIKDNYINIKIKKGIFVYFIILFIFQLLLYFKGLFSI